jgi:hypothetical protein
MSDSDLKFPDGIIVKKPHANAPDFVKAKLSLKKDELIAWLQKQEGEWINLDLKESKNGKYYVSIDDWKPNSESGNDSASENVPTEEDDLPF